MIGEVRRQHLIEDGQAATIEGLVDEAAKHELVVVDRHWSPLAAILLLAWTEFKVLCPALGRPPHQDRPWLGGDQPHVRIFATSVSVKRLNWTLLSGLMAGITKPARPGCSSERWERH